MKAIFLHGFGADCLSWGGNMSALPGIEMASPDLRGHGKALHRLNDGSIEDLATGVLEDVGDNRPAWLIGHSLGGGVALWLAAHYPERWKGLILMAPLGLGERLDVKKLEQYPDIHDEDEMMEFLNGLVFDPATIKREFAVYALSQLEMPGGRTALQKILEKLPETSETVQRLLPRVAENDLGVTVFWGRNDSVVRARPDLIADLGPLIEVPNVGHIVHVEAMDEINTHLRKTLGVT